MKEKIEVTEEMLQGAINSGSTLSSEYWCSLTDEQRSDLEEARRLRLQHLFSSVKNHEIVAGIHDLMNEYRALRIRRIAGREKEIRDLYFAIPTIESRKKAINDLVLLEKYRYNYFLSTRVLEAYYQYTEIRFGKTRHNSLREFGKLLLLLSAVLTTAYLLDSLTAGSVICGILFAGYALTATLAEADKRRMESDFYLQWGIEKYVALPYQIKDTGPYEGVDYHSFADLFSESEIKTGEIDPKFKYGRDPFAWLNPNP